MAQILTKLEAILKDKYQPALTNQINTEPSPFLEKIRKVNLTNNTIRCAAPIGINGGFGFGAEGVFWAEFVSQVVGASACMLTMYRSIWSRLRAAADG